ncbi:MAG TPA: ATP-dependent DNA helicase RecG [Candidatus Nitrosocosmicus sp.]|nr:ATP-dependent DNA helicase RecG [Candidatus Nitrosocosmicus sp.]
MLDIPIKSLPSTSSVTIKKLETLGIHTYQDLLNYFPYRYEDYSHIFSINNIQSLEEGTTVTIKGKIESFKNTYARNRITIQKAIISDSTGTIEIAWFNQPFLSRVLLKDSLISLSGIIKQKGLYRSLQPQEYEVIKTINSTTIHTGKIIPIYHAKVGLSTKVIRDKMKYVLSELQNLDEKSVEILPNQIILHNKLLDEKNAYVALHNPENHETLDRAITRLSFDELLIIQIATQLIKEAWQKKITGNRFNLSKNHELLYEFKKNLPFPLTKAQDRSADEILQDLTKDVPMNRFLQGDVGSGKTVVAAIACYFAYLNGYQSLYMAPTEILANQHYETLNSLFKNTEVKVGLQTGNRKDIKDGSLFQNYDVVIGTQALIQHKISFDKVGLVIIDEQHRFGVAQRAQLKKKGNNPHLLTMTATPIPRTVALTLYGDLDLSIIDEMPQGRIPIKTYFVPKEKRDSSYEWIKAQMKEHNSQVFVICPLIEESESETMKTVRAANLEYERLKNTVFMEFKVGLLHGKMKPQDKQQVMTDFKEKKYDILVSTSVVEVGIDIPNATIILIEGAERFGLAQLHQLRGRVGRGKKQSYCLLFSEVEDEKSINRLKFFSQTNSGIKLAEYDLKIRGSGNIFGTQQHGYRELKIAKLTDYDLISKSKKAAQDILKHYNLQDYPDILKRVEKYEIEQITRD